MTDFRFLHAADIHLDSPLKGLTGHEGHMAERVRSAPRAAFEQLIELAIDEKVDFLIIAGDLYDGTWRDYKTGLFFAEQMGMLNQAGIPVFLEYGNHDAESQITRPLVLPDNVKVFSARRPVTLQIETLNVALHGQSFRQRDVTDNLVPAYPSPLQGMFNIGVLHTGLGGRGGHANYAPCTLQDLIAKGYDYWALGHVHQREILHERPHIVFSGNLQGRHVQETGPKGACLVTAEGGDVIDVATMPVDVVRWAVLPVEVTGVETVGGVIDSIRQEVETAATHSEGRLLACRIQLQGRIEIHHRLVVDSEDLLSHARSAALGLGEEVAWIEGLIVDTTPLSDAASLAEREDAIGDLLQMLAGAGDDAGLLQSIEGDVGELVQRLPQDVRDEIEDTVLQTAVECDYAGLIEQVTPYLAALLAAEDD